MSRIMLASKMGLAGALTFAFVSSAAAQVNVMFIFDASGSMNRPAGNETRIVAAKRAFDETLANMPANIRVGLIAFGHRRRNDCSDIEFISPVGADKPAKLIRVVDKFRALGETPIAAAIDRAGDAMKAFKGQSNTIVLVTDGVEECGGNPCAAADRLVKLGIEVKVHVVGFALGAGQGNALKCIVDRTGGRFFDADNAKALTTALAQVREQVVHSSPKPVKVAQAPAPKPITEGAIINLVSKEGGGQMVAAPNVAWGTIISGNDKNRISADPGEAIFAFKDDKPATINSFSVLIPSTSVYNLKDFELATANDLSGPFKSIGKFRTKNIRLFRTPYQEFKFPPVVAKYLRFKTLTRYDGQAASMYLYQVRIMGRQ